MRAVSSRRSRASQQSTPVRPWYNLYPETTSPLNLLAQLSHYIRLPTLWESWARRIPAVNNHKVYVLRIDRKQWNMSIRKTLSATN